MSIDEKEFPLHEAAAEGNLKRIFELLVSG